MSSISDWSRDLPSVLNNSLSRNTTVNLVAENIKWKDIVANYEKGTGKKLKLNHTSLQQAEEELSQKPGDVIACFKVYFAHGDVLPQDQEKFNLPKYQSFADYMSSKSYF